jgi:hypothetical protein
MFHAEIESEVDDRDEEEIYKKKKKYKLNTRHISGYFKMLNNSRMNVSRLAHSMQCFSIIFNVGFKRNGRRKDLRLFDNFQRGKKRVKEVF